MLYYYIDIQNNIREKLYVVNRGKALKLGITQNLNLVVVLCTSGDTCHVAIYHYTMYYPSHLFHIE